MEKLAILAPAKINLYLNVGARRPDGYHEIESVMQTVSLFDRIDVVKNEYQGEPAIHLFCRNPKVPLNESNLIYRAAAAFFEEAEIHEFDVSFTLEKKIPVEAGLGGGSADAAAPLIALDRLYETSMTPEKLRTIGTRLGADVPFCIQKGTAYATGIGDILESAPPMPDCAFVIAIPKGSRISTAEAYRKIDNENETAAISFEEFCSAIAACRLDRVSCLLYNRFELVTEETSGSAALAAMLSANGAMGVRMSGSGPSVFAIFPNVSAARTAKNALPDTVEAFVCTPARRDYPYIET